MTPQSREQLRRVFAGQCLLTGADIKLSAGGTASFYFDCKRATLDGKCLSIIADWILDDVAANLKPPADVVGGPTLGADFIVAAAAMRAAERGLPMTDACIVRKEAKKHGTKNKIENEPQKGARVLVVEDVITTGGSIARACDELLAHGCVIAAIAALLDRGAGGKDTLAKQYNAPVFALFDKSDFDV